jgi:hypothetical protein
MFCLGVTISPRSSARKRGRLTGADQSHTPADKKARGAAPPPRPPRPPPPPPPPPPRRQQDRLVSLENDKENLTIGAFDRCLTRMRIVYVFLNTLVCCGMGLIFAKVSARPKKARLLARVGNHAGIRVHSGQVDSKGDTNCKRESISGKVASGRTLGSGGTTECPEGLSASLHMSRP